jgi:hypothetical protein
VPKVIKITIATTALLCLTSVQALAAELCPFCSAVSQTLRQEMEAMDAVAIAKIVKGSETDSDAEFSVISVIRGGNLIKEGQTARINYFGKAPEGTQFLLMGVDPPELLWSSPLPITPVAIEYVNKIPKLPEDPIKRLEFYLGFLEHPEQMLARDAYDEFASAPYPEMKLLKEKLDREKLLTWIQDTSLPPDRKRLYLVMLGICGKKEDSELLEKLLRSEDPNKRSGLDALIACYVTLQGDDGLKLIDELFLANKQSQYADTYAAIMALRFHGTDGGVVAKERVLKSMQLILQRPELADLVIPDLARWEDWSQIDRLVELFKTADEKSSWVRVPVINYLRSCPLPEAAAKIEELKELDPAAFKRATSFFPIPKPPTPATNQSSSVIPSTINKPQSPTTPLISGRSAIVMGTQADKAKSSDARLKIKPGMELARSSDVSHIAPVPPVIIAAVEPNRAFVVSVICMVSLTVWLAMWLAISGAGRPGALQYALAVKNPRK